MSAILDSKYLYLLKRHVIESDMYTDMIMYPYFITFHFYFILFFYKIERNKIEMIRFPCKSVKGYIVYGSSDVEINLSGSTVFIKKRIFSFSSLFSSLLVSFLLFSTLLFSSSSLLLLSIAFL